MTKPERTAGADRQLREVLMWIHQEASHGVQIQAAGLVDDVDAGAIR
jgi:hypothetical protein